MNIHKDIILGEITGKNAAIHAYDKIIWMIRSGYLTLLYGGWSIVLKAVVDQGGDFMRYKDIMIIMFSITISLAVGCYIVDKNYLRRKFRVIYALNKLFEYIFDMDDSANMSDHTIKKIRECIKVSGDSDNRNYYTDGYKQAVFAENAIFIISVLSLTLALLYIFWTPYFYYELS